MKNETMKNEMKHCVTRKSGSTCLWLMATALLAVLVLVSSGEMRAGVLPNDHWELLVIAYPPDRDVEIALGGAARTLTSRGRSAVKYQDDGAAMEIELTNLPSAQEAGLPGTQYVLWAVDQEKRATNLGVVPWSDGGAKWVVRVPFRVFGLLVTAEKNPQAEAPSTAVVLESLLPIDPFLVIPVFRINVPLNPPQG
jgi:hypothetical protein